MKFTVERDALAEAVTWAARALPGRPVLPVLTGLLLSAGQKDIAGHDGRAGHDGGASRVGGAAQSKSAGETDGAGRDDSAHREDSAGSDGGGAFLTLSCFDYEVSARVRVRAEVAEPGTVLVPGRLLVEIVRALPAHPVEFSDDPDGVSVTCGDASFMLTPLPLADYPALPELPQLAGTVDGGQLATAIGQVTPAASRDDTLPMLTAVSVELEGTTMTLAATDRYRLAVRELTWTPAPDPASRNAAGQGRTSQDGAGQVGAGQVGAGKGVAARGRVALLVPAKTLQEAARMMNGGTEVRVVLRHGGDGPDSAGRDGNARAGAGGGAGAAEAMIGFEAGQRRLTTRLLAGEFVRYKSRFPEEFGCSADLSADAFAEAVRRVALVAERGTPVQLSFAPGRVTIGAATQGQARAKETVAAEFTGDEPSIAFSPQYLLDGVIAATATGPDDQEPGSAQVRLRFTSAAKPAVITAVPGGGFRYLVVPQRLR
jgi:DNA polymerase-3 subunit beta